MHEGPNAVKRLCCISAVIATVTCCRLHMGNGVGELFPQTLVSMRARTRQVQGTCRNGLCFCGVSATSSAGDQGYPEKHRRVLVSVYSPISAMAK